MALILIIDDSPTEVHVMQKALESMAIARPRRRTAPKASASPAR